MLMQPLMTSSPALTSRSADSPVSDTVFSSELPSSTLPSSGIFSPGRTTMTSPTFTSSGESVTSAPSRSTVAVSGRMSISAAIDLRLLPTAMLWNSSPT